MVYSMLSNTTSTRRELSRPRLAIIYPWSDLHQWSSGASLRVNLLLDFLDDYEIDVRVLQIGTECYHRSRTIEVEAAPLAKPPFFLRKYIKAISRLAKEDHFVCAERLKFDQANESPEFMAKLRSVSEWADIILLKYPFFFGDVKKITVKDDRKHSIIVSVHDILHDHARHSHVIRDEIKRREMEAYCRADGLVVVSPLDRMRLKALGVNALLIPHPARFSVALPQAAAVAPQEHAGSTNFPVAGKTICFFIGSEYPPNVEAVTQIRRIASEARKMPSLRDVIFVVAGRCAPAEKDENFWSLGPVSEQQLKSIYAAAKIVLIPLLFGTGSSLKTIEAMGAGKIVMGTKLAFRGYAVENSTHCIIEDNIDLYHMLLWKLIHDDPGRLEIMARKAADFAKENDFRSVFTSYWELFGVTPKKKVDTSEIRISAVT